MRPAPSWRLRLARKLAARWLPASPHDQRRVDLDLVIALADDLVADDPALLGDVEVRYIVDELLRRGRREDGGRVTEDDLRETGLR